MNGDAWCGVTHDRAGMVSNQSRFAAYDQTRSLVVVTVCAAEKCIAKGIRHVSGCTDETATYEPDRGTR